MTAPRRDYRVGLVGFGGRGESLCRYWQGVQGAKLIAVADLLPERLDKARETLGDVQCYSDPRNYSHYYPRQMPADVLAYFDAVDPGEPGAPATFRCERCPGSMYPD